MFIVLILISWVIFAFDDLSILKIYLSKMFVNNILIDKTTIFYIKNYFVIFLFAFIFSTPIVKKIKPNICSKTIVAIVYIILFIMTIASLVGDSYNPFLYFRF